jgi:hypothetical protein
VFFPSAVSLNGQLLFNKHLWVNSIVEKIYQDDQHPMAAELLSADIEAHTTSIRELYGHLMEKYAQDIKSGLSRAVNSISNHKITIDDQKIEYDKIINTIPLDAFLSITKLRLPLQADDYHVFLVATDAFDLEGAKRCFIGDMAIPFWKVNVVNRNLFQFFANGPVEGAEQIFSLLTKDRYKLIGATSVENAFPKGAPPHELLNKLEADDITCVGSNARWDYFHNVSAALNLLLKLKDV